MDAVKEVLNYIFQHEQEDFQENPSKNHIYYLAYVADCGEALADQALEDALTVLNSEENKEEARQERAYDRFTDC